MVTLHKTPEVKLILKKSLKFGFNRKLGMFGCFVFPETVSSLHSMCTAKYEGSTPCAELTCSAH